MRIKSSRPLVDQSMKQISTLYIGLMRRSSKFCQRGSIFDNVFFSWWGDRGSKYHYKWAIIGPPAKRHLNGVSLAGRWLPNIECWLFSFVIFQGIWTSIAKKPYISVIFQRGSGPPVPPSGYACGSFECKIVIHFLCMAYSLNILFLLFKTTVSLRWFIRVVPQHVLHVK